MSVSLLTALLHLQPCIPALKASLIFCWEKAPFISGTAFTGYLTIYFDEQHANLDFYLTTSYFYPQLGGLGLQLYPSNNQNTATPDIDKTLIITVKTNIITTKLYKIFLIIRQLLQNRI